GRRLAMLNRSIFRPQNNTALPKAKPTTPPMTIFRNSLSGFDFLRRRERSDCEPIGCDIQASSAVEAAAVCVAVGCATAVTEVGDINVGAGRGGGPGGGVGSGGGRTEAGGVGEATPGNAGGVNGSTTWGNSTGVWF